MRSCATEMFNPRSGGNGEAMFNPRSGGDCEVQPIPSRPRTRPGVLERLNTRAKAHSCRE